MLAAAAATRAAPPARAPTGPTSSARGGSATSAAPCRASSGGTFCIDLRFWYPARRFGYEERSAAGLRNRDGDAISSSGLRRMSYALWRFGRSDNANQQAAVMLYVHGIMGDGAPGEVTPSALSSRSRAIHKRIRREAARYAGPYRIQASVPDGLAAGREAELELQVVGAAGRPVPGVEVELDARGASGLPESVAPAAAASPASRSRPTTRPAGSASRCARSTCPPTSRRSTSPPSARRASTRSASSARPAPPCAASCRRRSRPRRRWSRRSAPSRSTPGTRRHRHREGLRARRPDGDGRSRAPRPVRLGGGDDAAPTSPCGPAPSPRRRTATTSRRR